MEHIFDVSQRYSKALDELRGPGHRKKEPIQRVEAWTRQSLGRRAVVRLVAFTAITGIAGALAFGFLRNEGRVDEKIRDKIAS